MRTCWKHLCSMLLALSILLVSFGCGRDAVPDAEKKYESRPNVVTICLSKGGYGEQWLRDVAIFYMDHYNSDTYYKVIPSVMNVEEGSKVTSGLASRDIYFLEYPFDKDDPILDLSDIVTDKPTGEDEHTIEEKLGYLADIYKDVDGKYYQLPWSGAGTYAYTYAYNKTTLDEALGAGEWRLPRTTKEFTDLGDALKAKNVFLTAASYGDQTAYMNRGLLIWFAQVAGLEGYRNFLNGNYWTGNEWAFSSDTPRMIEQNRDAIEAMYSAITDVARVDNHYFHNDSLAMTFANVESAFSGHGFGLNSRKVAFLFNGPWLDNEVAYLTEAMQAAGKPQELGWMKIPVSSDIVGAQDAKGNLRLETVTDEAKLREAISYVDGELGTSKPSWISEKDIETLTEVRCMYPTLITGGAVIPENSKNSERAKEFLKFIASDEAMIASAKSLNGLNMLPYTAYGDPIASGRDSHWVRSYIEATRNLIPIDSNLREFPQNSFSIKTGFRPYESDYLEYNILTTKASDVKTASQYFESVKTYYTGRWSQILGTWNN